MMSITLSFPWLTEWSFWGGYGLGVGTAVAVALIIFFTSAKA
jgi:hypothetical protein